MINIKPATNRNLKTTTLDFKYNTFVGLRSDGKWHCVPTLYENNLYLLSEVRFDRDNNGPPVYNAYDSLTANGHYLIEDCPDIEHQTPEMQLLIDLYYGNVVRLLTDDWPIVCQNSSWFAEDDLGGLIPCCPVFFYYEGWYMAYSYSEYEDCKVYSFTVDYKGVSSTLSTLEGVL